MATRYLVGVTVAAAVVWDNAATANWSASSGGASGASAPTSADDVIVDANSGTGTLKLASTAVCNTFTQSGVNNINVIRFTDGMTFHTSRWRVSGPGGASTKFGWLPGVAGNYFSTPDAAANEITGDIDIRVNVALTDWAAPANDERLVCKRNAGGGAPVMYDFYVLQTSGKLGWYDGVSVNSSVALGFTNGTVHWVRVTRRASDGQILFFTSPDGTTWTQLGISGTGTVGAVPVANVSVNVGMFNDGNTAPARGQIYRAQILNGIGGTVAVDFNPDASYSTGTTWTAATGEVWTINGAALVSATDKIALSGTGTAGWNIVMDATGTPASDYISLNHSTATGTWFAGSHSINGGSNSGWSFTQVGSSFTGTRAVGDQRDTYNFTDTSQFSPTTWSWDFGDGNTSTQQNPTHTYVKFGSYTITFTSSYGTMIATQSSLSITDSDVHDAGLKPWHQKIEKSEIDKRAKEYRSSRERLREDIVFAMDGPAEAEVLDVIRSELDPEDFAKFGAPDYEPELRGLLSQTEALRKLARLVLEERARIALVEYEAAEQDDEEAIMLLLN